MTVAMRGDEVMERSPAPARSTETCKGLQQYQFSAPFLSKIVIVVQVCCETQGKGRAKGRLRKVTQWSFIDYSWSIINILFPKVSESLGLS